MRFGKPDLVLGKGMTCVPGGAGVGRMVGLQFPVINPFPCTRATGRERVTGRQRKGSKRGEKAAKKRRNDRRREKNALTNRGRARGLIFA